MHENESFYWRNPQGVSEEHPISDFRHIIFGEPRQEQTTSGENTGESIREARGKSATEIDDTIAVSRVEKEITQSETVVYKNDLLTTK